VKLWLLTKTWNFEEEGGGEEQQKQKQQLQASAEVEPQAATCG